MEHQNWAFLIVVPLSLLLPTLFTLLRAKRARSLFAGWWTAWQTQLVPLPILASVYLLLLFELPAASSYGTFLIYGAVLLQTFWLLFNARQAFFFTSAASLPVEEIRGAIARQARRGLVVGSISLGAAIVQLWPLLSASGQLSNTLPRVLAVTGIYLVITTAVAILVASVAIAIHLYQTRLSPDRLEE